MNASETSVSTVDRPQSKLDTCHFNSTALCFGITAWSAQAGTSRIRKLGYSPGHPAFWTESGNLRCGVEHSCKPKSSMFTITMLLPTKLQCRGFHRIPKRKAEFGGSAVQDLKTFPRSSISVSSLHSYSRAQCAVTNY